MCFHGFRGLSRAMGRSTALFVAVAITGCGDGLLTPQRQIQTLHLGEGFNPDIAGDRVTWQLYSGGPLVHLDLRTGRSDTLRFADSGVRVDHPGVYGERLVWMQHPQESHDGRSSIALLSLPARAPEQVTEGTARDRFPQLSERFLVWERRADRTADVFLLDLTTGQHRPITAGETRNVQPSVDGTNVVWTQLSTGDDGDVSAYRVLRFETSTGEIRTLSEDERPHGNPDVSGDVVTWVSPDGDLVYMDPEVDEAPILGVAESDPSFPAISVPWIVWEKHGSDNDIDIWAHNIETGETVAVTSDPVRQSRPAISGDRVVWSELREGHWQVVMAILH